MNSQVPVTADTATALPSLIDRAANALAGARNAAEVLEAGEMASLAYDAAKRAARLSKAKGAHDELVATAHRTQASALEIEAQAKRKLADEYDAAQERGEVAKHGRPEKVVSHDLNKPTLEDVGFSKQQIHEARLVRDAENADPGIVQRTVDEAVSAGEEPTRAKVRRAVLRTVKPDVPEQRPARGREAIIKRVREALMALSGLPPASEVVGLFQGTDAAVIVDDHIAPAARWLSEFSDLWGDDNVE